GRGREQGKAAYHEPKEKQRIAPVVEPRADLIFLNPGLGRKLGPVLEPDRVPRRAPQQVDGDEDEHQRDRQAGRRRKELLRRRGIVVVARVAKQAHGRGLPRMIAQNAAGCRLPAAQNSARRRAASIQHLLLSLYSPSIITASLATPDPTDA